MQLGTDIIALIFSHFSHFNDIMFNEEMQKCHRIVHIALVDLLSSNFTFNFFDSSTRTKFFELCMNWSYCINMHCFIIAWRVDCAGRCEMVVWLQTTERRTLLCINCTKNSSFDIVECGRKKMILNAHGIDEN